MAISKKDLIERTKKLVIMREGHEQDVLELTSVIEGLKKQIKALRN